MLLRDLVVTGAAVARTSGRRAKIELLAALLERLEQHEIAVAVAFLSGRLLQGRIGIGPSAIMAAKPSAAADTATLRLADVDAVFGRMATTSGSGSTAARVSQLRDLLSRATGDEQDFLIRLLFGELRHGALEGILLEAVARASGISADTVRRSAMVAGDVTAVAHAALIEGEPGLSRFTIQLLRPVQPMLAQPAADLIEAFDDLQDEASLEWKLDGARIQVHKAGDDVAVFSRNLRDVTAAVPEIVEAARTLPAHDAIVDGEAIALRPDGAPYPFQVTMQRFGRRLDVDRLRAELPLTPFLFDCLYLDGESLVDRPQGDRFAALTSAARRLVVPSLIKPTREEAQRFLDDALSRGHEGVMAKAIGAAYAAGRRGQAWLKIKVARTLDLVVLAAEWGHGRRKGWLSNLHLGARDPAHGGFVMLGKTFKGLTDQSLAWQTEKLLSLELSRDAYVVYVRPELVVEIEFDGLQKSPHYPGGLALRFARVKSYRPDKPATEADTIDTVRDIYHQSTRA